MRLINVNTLALEEYIGIGNLPPYAILSHTWDREEVTFADWQRGGFKDLKGWQKIQGCIKEVINNDLSHLWVDTCCIDKGSSAELSEAINSMFQWYQGAVICYAYLSDVEHIESFRDLRKARWFTRGWTLQELIAPAEVAFYDTKWSLIGRKSKMTIALELQAITRISPDVLGDSKQLQKKSISARMSWAAGRTTTRPEDIAYCLLGIFDVNMPLLYGEGDRAFLRLQEELCRTTNDHSLFAWGNQFLKLPDHEGHSSGFAEAWPLFAPNPEAFRWGHIIDHFGQTYGSRPSQSNEGLYIRLPVVLGYDTVRMNQTVAYKSCRQAIALLGCGSSEYPNHFFGMPLAIYEMQPTSMRDPLDHSALVGRRCSSTSACPTQLYSILDVLGAKQMEVCIAPPNLSTPAIQPPPNVVVTFICPNDLPESVFQVLWVDTFSADPSPMDLYRTSGGHDDDKMCMDSDSFIFEVSSSIVISFGLPPANDRPSILVEFIRDNTALKCTEIGRPRSSSTKSSECLSSELELGRRNDSVQFDLDEQLTMEFTISASQELPRIVHTLAIAIRKTAEVQKELCHALDHTLTDLAGFSDKIVKLRSSCPPLPDWQVAVLNRLTNSSESKAIGHQVLDAQNESDGDELP